MTVCLETTGTPPDFVSALIFFTRAISFSTISNWPAAVRNSANPECNASLTGAKISPVSFSSGRRMASRTILANTAPRATIAPGLASTDCTMPGSGAATGRKLSGAS